MNKENIKKMEGLDKKSIDEEITEVDEEELKNKKLEDKEEIVETESIEVEAEFDMKKIEEEKKKHKKALENLQFEMEDLDPKYQAVVRLIGCEPYRRLSNYCGGQYIYVPKLKKLLERKRREYIYNVFLENNSDYKKTAVYCDLCISTVRKYVREQKRAIYDKKRRDKKKKEKQNKKTK